LTCSTASGAGLLRQDLLAPLQIAAELRWRNAMEHWLKKFPASEITNSVRLDLRKTTQRADVSMRLEIIKLSLSSNPLSVAEN
jgi:hypothetical protein